MFSLLTLPLRNIQDEQQVVLIDQLWSLWEVIPSYGHRAVQFVDLLGYFTVKTSHPALQQNMVSMPPVGMEMQCL